MKTKKILSFVLAIAMMFSLSITSFAAETNTHELIYKNDASYEISIPDTSNIDVSTGKGEIDVSVTNAKLEDFTEIVISVSSSNYANDSWNLVNTKNSKDKITYTIGTTEGANDIASGDRVVTASEVTDATLYVTVSDTSKVGTFTDTITFTSEIVESMISFEFFLDGETIALQAPKGMTWLEWIESPYNEFEVINNNGLLMIVDKGWLWQYDLFHIQVLPEDEIIPGAFYDFTFAPEV